MTKTIPHFDNEEEGVTVRSVVSVVFFASVAIFMYPLIYPVLDYILGIVDFAEKPGLQSAVSLYNTFTGNDLFAEHPIMAAIPYWGKVNILYFIYFNAYLLLVTIAAVGTILFGLSRVVPTRLFKSFIRWVAMTVSFFPLLAVWLYTMGMIIYSYYLAWQEWSGSLVGYLDFALLVVAFPVVWAHVMSVLLGIWIMAYIVPPSALAFSGAYSEPSRTLKSFWSLILG